LSQSPFIIKVIEIGAAEIGRFSMNCPRSRLLIGAEAMNGSIVGNQAVAFLNFKVVNPAPNDSSIRRRIGIDLPPMIENFRGDIVLKMSFLFPGGV